jgi:hypothetical protein
MTLELEWAKHQLFKKLERTAWVFGTGVPEEDAAYTYAYVMYPEDCPAEIGKWYQSVTYVGYTTDAKKRARTHFNAYLNWGVQVNRVMYSPPMTASKARKLEVTWSRSFDGIDFYLRSAVYQKLYDADTDLWPVDAESARFWGARSARARNALLADPDQLDAAFEGYSLSEAYKEWVHGQVFAAIEEAKISS